MQHFTPTQSKAASRESSDSRWSQKGQRVTVGQRGHGTWATCAVLKVEHRTWRVTYLCVTPPGGCLKNGPLYRCCQIQSEGFLGSVFLALLSGRIATLCLDLIFLLGGSALRKWSRSLQMGGGCSVGIKGFLWRSWMPCFRLTQFTFDDQHFFILYWVWGVELHLMIGFHLDLFVVSFTAAFFSLPVCFSPSWWLLDFSQLFTVFINLKIFCFFCFRCCRKPTHVVLGWRQFHLRLKNTFIFF